MEQKKKIVVLFGAGAECSEPFNLSAGKEFAEEVAGYLNNTKMESAIKKFYKKRIEKLDWCSAYYSEKISEDSLIKASIKREYLDEKKYFSTAEEFDQRVSDEYKKYKIKGNFRDLLKAHASFMGVLDEKFHALIEPKALGPRKIWKVINCYTRAYLSLVEKMVKKSGKDLEESDYLELLESPGNTYEKIKKFANSKKDDKSYYKIIREANKGNCEINIVTLNYTPICELITEIKENHIAYVHGKFGMFEEPSKLEVLDLHDKENFPEGLYFPYIFIQSGVKPIVESWQITQYSKMIKFLDEADTIVVCGYRLNVDDNHINSILRKYVLDEKKEVVVLDYDEEISEDMVKERLKIKHINRTSLVYRRTNEENTYKIFGNYLY